MEDKYYLKIGRASDLENPKERRLYRALEIMPGLLAWATLIIIISLSFIVPTAAAIFIILFDVYWLLKTIFLSIHLRSSFSKMRKNMKIEWLEKLKQQDGWQDVYHLVLLPFYKEGVDIVEGAVKSLVETNYPKDKMIVVLAAEGRAEGSEEIARIVEEKYKDKFFKFMVTVHPADVLGEMPGKGSNTAHAGRKIKEEIDRWGISYEDILVSNFDIDTIVYKEYFGILTHKFLNTPNRLRTSYQPIPLYLNNIWQAPSVSRVVALSGTFWHTLQQERQERLVSFSSHSIPFKALVDVGFWQVNMVNEDSRIFWQCFLKYDGDYRVTPLYYPVSMDAPASDSLMKTGKVIYKQQRRWGYGVENIPYFLFGFYKNKLVPKAKKWSYGFALIEGFHSWATNAFIIFFLGWLPAIVGGIEFRTSVMSLNLPYLTGWIMKLAMVGLFTSVFLSILILPPRPKGFSRLKYIEMVGQWILFYITIILFGAMPGIDAQTRLMFGKYMGFWVTPKKKLN